LARRYVLLNYGVKMKKFQLMSVVGLSITLFACGGSSSGSDVEGSDIEGSDIGGSAVYASKEEFIKKISATSWINECSHMNINGLTDSKWSYFDIKISINSSLESITTAIQFSESDCNHHSRGEKITFTTQLEVTDKIISEEGIEVYGLNTYFIESPDIAELPPAYSVIYLNSEKLYYGTSSGKAKETRHASISLDDYFWQVRY
jgi:hypothetical protein